MNRYRTIPGLGQPKASATTTCQKCLKKDDYECKSTTQERPYMSRPSRTQQLANPKLKPKLASETAGNSLMKTQGIADEQLARAQAARDVVADDPARRSRSPEPALTTSKRHRSVSISSYGSVSTISTSRSRSPHSRRRISPARQPRDRDRSSRSRSISKHRKRKYHDSSMSPSPPRFDSNNKARRYRSGSPEHRGRPANDRRGSNRSRSRDGSADRSEITKQRRSLDQIDEGRSNSRTGQPYYQSGKNENRRPPPVSKERSLSPYSRRLALTQAMNMGR